MKLVKILSFALGLQLVLTACGSPVSLAEQYADRKEAGHPLVIRQAYTKTPNSAGGVDVFIDFVNLSDKTVKYVNWTAIPYNAVGDKVRGEISRRSEVKFLKTGPISPYEGTRGYWETLWYNYSIICMEITRLSIEYMDGSKKTYANRNSIATLMRLPVKNSCRL